MVYPNVSGARDKVSRFANLENRISVSEVRSREVTEMYCACSFINSHTVWTMQLNLSRPLDKHSPLYVSGHLVFN